MRFGWRTLLYALHLKGREALAKDVARIVVDTLREHGLLFWEPFKDPLWQPEYHNALRYCQAYGLVEISFSSDVRLKLTEEGAKVAELIGSSLPKDVKATVERLVNRTAKERQQAPRGKRP